jgi:nucleoside-diphosphate-sugar epimerase
MRGAGASLREAFIVGATSRVGRALIEALHAQDVHLVAIARGAAAGRALPDAVENRVADFTDATALRRALAGARRAAICAPVRFVPEILSSVPASVERVVILGSARKFTRFPDKAADRVRRAERAFAESALPGIMLHPTMIYGAQGENNVQRLAEIIRRFRVIPLPADSSLVQPVHLDDLVACLCAALTRFDLPKKEIVVAGPVPMTYRAMVRAIADAIGVRAVIVPVPRWAALAAASLGTALLRAPPIRPDEIRRLSEDKAHDIADMKTLLGVTPIAFAEGLARTFTRKQVELSGPRSAPGRGG